MKYIVYWILSWTVQVECPPQVDEFGRVYTNPYNRISIGEFCTENRTKKSSKEFDTFESAAAFLARANKVRQEESKSWFHSVGEQKIDTVWIETVNEHPSINWSDFTFSGDTAKFSSESLKVIRAPYIQTLELDPRSMMRLDSILHKKNNR